MDEKPSSDQTNTSTTIMVIWILTGILLVCGAFFVAPYSNPRLDFNVAGIVAAMYLLVLVLYIARKPLRLFPRIAVVVLALFAMGVTAFSWMTTQESILQQKETQREQRTIIERARLYTTMSDHLLSVLKSYYEKNTKRETLEAVFRHGNGPVKVGDRLNIQYKSFYTNEPLYLAAIAPDTIALVGIKHYFAGRDPGYRNFDGKSGGIQERITLTPKGIFHESEN